MAQNTFNITTNVNHNKKDLKMKNILLATLLINLTATAAVIAEGPENSVPTQNTDSAKEVSMDTVYLRDALSELTHIHFDNAGMFNKAATIAINHGHPDLQEKFLSLATAKEKQAQELNAIIVANGGHPVEAKMDAKGTMMKGYVKLDAAVRGLKGLYGALETNMNLSLKYYDKFTKVPAEVKETLEKQHTADKEVLAYVSTQYATLKN